MTLEKLFFKYLAIKNLSDLLNEKKEKNICMFIFIKTLHLLVKTTTVCFIFSNHQGFTRKLKIKLFVVKNYTFEINM